MVVMRVRLAVLAGLFGLCCVAGGARPHHPAPRGTPPAAAAPPAIPQTLSIIVVDVQSLLQNSKAAKMVRQQIEAKRAEYAKEISHREEALRQERDALQRQQASLTADQLNAKGRDFQAKVNELDRDVQAKRQALER